MMNLVEEKSPQLKDQIVIRNGRTNGDKKGLFTHFNSNAEASTIDLAIASDSIIKHVKSFCVQQQDDFSTHCKIVLRLNNKKPNELTPTDLYPWEPINKKYIWDIDTTPLFEYALK